MANRGRPRKKQDSVESAKTVELTLDQRILNVQLEIEKYEELLDIKNEELQELIHQKELESFKEIKDLMDKKHMTLDDLRNMITEASDTNVNDTNEEMSVEE